MALEVRCPSIPVISEIFGYLLSWGLKDHSNKETIIYLTALTLFVSVKLL